MAKDSGGHGSEGRGGTVLSGMGAVSRGAAHSSGVQSVGKVPSMTAQHFNFIANTLANHAASVRSDPIAHAALVSNFADRLAQSNPQFDKARFIAAAGVGKK